MGTTHAVAPAGADGAAIGEAGDVAYEGQIAGDLVRRLLIVSPLVLVVAGVAAASTVCSAPRSAWCSSGSTSSLPPV